LAAAGTGAAAGADFVDSDVARGAFDAAGFAVTGFAVATGFAVSGFAVTGFVAAGLGAFGAGLVCFTVTFDVAMCLAFVGGRAAFFGAAAL
jgi:hypothetical protein